MDETGWKFELKFTGGRGLHPDKTYSISRSDDMLGDGGCVFLLRTGSDDVVEVPYRDLSRLSLRDISFDGTPVVKVKRSFGGNIVGEWLATAKPASRGVDASGAPEVKRTATKPAPSLAPIRIDSTFGGSGAAFGDFRDPSAVARALAAEPDGQVIVAGTVGHEGDPEGRNIALIRFDANGEPDPQFGTDGYKVLDVEGVDNVARAIARQPDGKIVVAGEIVDPARGTYDFSVMRLDAKGQLDADFSGGFVTTYFFRNKDERVYAVGLQSDGKIVAAGGHWLEFVPDNPDDTLARPGDTSADVEDFALARYNRDGSPDMTFDGNGLAMPVMAMGYEARASARALQVQSDGRVVVCGFATNSHDPRVREVAVARLNPDGGLDRSFGHRGRVFLSSGGADEGAHAVAVQPDHKIVIAGATARDSASDQHFLLARLNPDGTCDRTFGGTGMVVNRTFTGLARGVVVLGDGRIVAAGSAAVTKLARNGEPVTREQVALVCCLSDGSADETFGTNGVMFVDLGGEADSTAGIVMNGDTILVAATSRSSGKSEFAAIRLVIG